MTEETYDAKTNVNQLTGIDLWEVSILTFPANVDATVSEIKSILKGGRMPTLAEFEASLREVGWSRTQAKIIAGDGLKGLLKQRDADEGHLDDKRVESMLALFDTPMKL